MPLNEYLNIDLNKDGDRYKELMEKIEDEATDREAIHIPDQVPALPSLITSEMNTWYRTHIHGIRQQALEHVKSSFKSTRGKETDGFLLEAELEEIEKTMLKKIQVDIKKFRDERSVNKLSNKLKEKEESYQQECRKQGREAKEWNPMYWIGIVIVIIVEGLLNFESFTKIPGVTPFFATGMTLATAIFIGYAAHRHGIFIRQFSKEMGGHQGRKNKSTTLARELIALLLLIVALGIVAWGRYNLLIDTIQYADLTGDGDSLSGWLQLAGAMLGNIGVYLFGVLWSYWNHDPIPGFMELRMEAETLDKEYSKIYSKQITTRVQTLRAQAEEDIEKKTNEESANKNLAQYDKNRQLFQQFQKKDSEVMALLDRYRNDLVQSIRQKNNSTLFILPEGVLIDEEIQVGKNIEKKELTPDEYLTIELRLKYLTS